MEHRKLDFVPDAQSSTLSRRGVLAGGATVAVAAAAVGLAGCSKPEEQGAGAQSANQTLAPGAKGNSDAQGETPLADAIVAFDGAHQAGVATPSQAHLNLVGFGLKDGIGKRDVQNLMRLWTEDARALCTAETPRGSLEPEMTQVPANLTVTCGWGEGFFKVAGVDKPKWLGDVKKFSKDKLQKEWGQTDLVLQICCDDATTASHVMRHMVRSAVDYAQVEWVQQGFLNANGSLAKGATPRNLFGQVDGTVNPRTEEALDEQVWIEDGAFAGGTAMVVRRIQMNLDTWEELDRTSRENSLGRDLATGAPLSGGTEHDTVDLEARDKYGLKIVDKNSHVALSMPPKEHPEQRLLRRQYNYDLPPNPASPELKGQLSNAGLVFICFQKDPRTQFEPIQERLDGSDMLNTWITHIGSAMYFVPAGTEPTTYWGENLLEG